jgi:HTH-type transcriptional regulator/antitoxin HigA
MGIKPIKTKKDYSEALERVDALWDAKAKTSDSDELDVLTTLIASYEDQHFPISKPNPIDAIRFRMDQMGLEDQDLTPYIGARSKVSEVLNLKRGLSLAMIRKLSNGLNIPAESLIQDYHLTR